MALLNKIYHYVFVAPFIAITAIPALIIAIITTFLALLTLSLRIFALGADLALRLMPYYLSKPYTEQTLTRPQLHRSKLSFNSEQDRKRRASSLSPKSTTPTGSLSLNLGFDTSRDYEGLGGWRLSRKLDDQDILWETINSRLELPGEHGRRRIASWTSQIYEDN